MGEMSKIEEVARAIAEKYHGRKVTREYLLGEATGGLVFVECAKAAIEALRVPTEAMKKSAAFSDNISTSFGGDQNSFDYISEEDAGNIFDMMLDAALKE